MTHIYVDICNYIYILSSTFIGGAFHCHVRLLEAILSLTRGIPQGTSSPSKKDIIPWQLQIAENR